MDSSDISNKKVHKENLIYIVVATIFIICLLFSIVIFAMMFSDTMVEIGNIDLSIIDDWDKKSKKRI